MRVPCDLDAPRRVRAALEDIGEIAPVRDDALLVTSELVTNAVLHSGCAEGESLQISVTRRDEALLITVDDPGASGGRAVPQARDAGGAGGRGLRLVASIARCWGAERRGGHRVWAELGLPR